MLSAMATYIYAVSQREVLEHLEGTESRLLSFCPNRRLHRNVFPAWLPRGLLTVGVLPLTHQRLDRIPRRR